MNVGQQASVTVHSGSLNDNERNHFKNGSLSLSLVVADKPKSEGHTVCPSWLLTGTVNNLSVCPLAELVDRVSPSW
jgi:hypothetical protein